MSLFGVKTGKTAGKTALLTAISLHPSLTNAETGTPTGNPLSACDENLCNIVTKIEKSSCEGKKKDRLCINKAGRCLSVLVGSAGEYSAGFVNCFGLFFLDDREDLSNALRSAEIFGDHGLVHAHFAEIVIEKCLHSGV